MSFNLRNHRLGKNHILYYIYIYIFYTLWGCWNAPFALVSHGFCWRCSKMFWPPTKMNPDPNEHQRGKLGFSYRARSPTRSLNTIAEVPVVTSDFIQFFQNRSKWEQSRSRLMFDVILLHPEVVWDSECLVCCIQSTPGRWFGIWPVVQV